MKCRSHAGKALSSSIAAGAWSNNETVARHRRAQEYPYAVYAFSSVLSPSGVYLGAPPHGNAGMGVEKLENPSHSRDKSFDWGLRDPMWTPAAGKRPGRRLIDAYACKGEVVS